MLRALRRLGTRLRSRSSLEQGRPVENVDAGAAADQQHNSPFNAAGGAPPGWVKSYDEGRPRK
jgi:hypothetical protein